MPIGPRMDAESTDLSRMGTRSQRGNHSVLEVRELSEGTYVLRLERQGFRFAAGQCASVGIAGEGLNREYSIYSGEGDEWLEFLIREVSGGTVSPRLRRLRPGAQVEVLGPFSEFRIDRVEAKDPAAKYLFVASGTGIAPFHSYVRSRPNGLDYTVLHGIRQENEEYDRSHYAPGRYVPCLSKERVDGKFHGRVTEYLRSQPSLDPSLYAYICGNQRMVVETYDLLREKGLHNDRIHTEVFF